MKQSWRITEPQAGQCAAATPVKNRQARQPLPLPGGGYGENRRFCSPLPVEAAGRSPLKPKDARRGTVLMFTLAVLLLVSLMGAAVLLSSRSAPPQSDSGPEHEAFLTADSAAELAVRLTRFRLKADLNKGAEPPAQIGPFTVTYSENFDLAVLLKEAREENNDRRRYLRTWSSPEDAPELQAQIFFWRGRKLAATAAVSLDSGPARPAGMSLGESDYDWGRGASAVLTVVVSVNGQSADEDNKNAGGSPHSLITTIFREVY